MLTDFVNMCDIKSESSTSVNLPMTLSKISVLEVRRMPKKSVAYNFRNLTGERFARLVVIERAPSNGRQGTYWLCSCDCGNRIVVAARHLTTGKTQSCKCLWEKRIKHGGTTHTKKSREYRAWIDAKRRCFNLNYIGYQNWGGRGITMCNEWRDDFGAFFRDMGPCPEGYELDRYPNNDGDYEKGNCRWTTHSENNRNTRRSRFVTYHGVTKTLIQWSKELGIEYKTLSCRLNDYHWTVEKAFTIPVKVVNRGH